MGNLPFVPTFVHDMKLSTHQFFLQNKQDFPFFDGWTRSYCALRVRLWKRRMTVLDSEGKVPRHGSPTPLSSRLNPI